METYHKWMFWLNVTLALINTFFLFWTFINYFLLFGIINLIAAYNSYCVLRLDEPADRNSFREF